MNYQRLVFWLVFAIYWGDATGEDLEQMQDVESEKFKAKTAYSVLSESLSQAVNVDSAQDACRNDDFVCLSQATTDKLALEAIQALHEKLDDDANGNIDLSETKDFLREDLKYNHEVENKQKVFHYNDDTQISVKELWEAWLRSEVHNWTIEQTTEWLTVSVELPQYVPNFIRYKVTGATLPRLAANNMHFLSMIGIKDPIHKQKISLKAMDIVLFGPPKDSQPGWKDLTLVTLVIGSVIGLWYGYQQQKKFKKHLHRMNRDMEGLQKAECTLQDLQKQLEQAKEDKDIVEKKLQEDSSNLHCSYSDLEVSQLKAEIEMLRAELQIAEGELKDRCWSPPPGLQQWLQLTHEIENKAYMKKKMSAEKQLQQAREACEKLRKKRSNIVSAFVSTHGKSIDDVDRSIVEARTSLNEVTQELQERVHRWKQIEMLCGFNIINNNGLQSLENALYSRFNGRFGLRGRMSSQDDLDDDTSSLYTSSQGFVEQIHGPHWKDLDSSGSEGSKPEEDALDLRTAPGVHFLVGGETHYHDDSPPIIQKNLRSFPQPSTRSISNNNILIATSKKSNMTRSYSQDASISQNPETSGMKQKPSYSDSSLDNNKIKPVIHKTIKEHSPGFLEDDIYSTDSSIVDEETKKKKRKLFPGFSKKNKNKCD